MKKMRFVTIAAAAGFLSACMTPSAVNLKASDAPGAAKLQSVKRVAIMPLFNANSLGSDDPDPSYKGKYKDMIPTTIVYNGVKDSARFAFVSMEDVVSTLKKNGFEGVKLKEGEDVSVMTAMFHPDAYRTGYTMQQALTTGKALKADAILIAATGMVGSGNKMSYVMSMRLVDPRTGEVLWGAAKSEEPKTSLFHPIDAYTEQLQEMAKSLIAEVP